MDVSPPLLADAAFPDEFLVFSSRDFDAVRAGVARRRHHAEPLTIETLAAVAGVSTRTLFAGFRDFRRVSPMTYLKSFRLDKARQALQSGEVGGVTGVTKVALDNGFSHRPLRQELSRPLWRIAVGHGADEGGAEDAG